jgi:2-polyprenyl-3-methyl-5-hydroxy-6-metoxy-1,4-benzoquinol methylase
VVNQDAVTELQANEHDLVEVDRFYTVEEYVLYLMHMCDYLRAQQLVADKDVLDLGCNNGYGTGVLGARCRRIVGVDVSPTAISRAKLKYQSVNTSFQQVDGIVLPFADDSFDVITSFQVVEHLSDYQAYFGEICRVLRPCGVVLLTTPNACIRVLPGGRPWNRFHVHEFRPNELLQLVCGIFDFSQVVGQFASAATYGVEYARCVRARDSGHGVSGNSFRARMLLLSRAMKSVVRRMLGAKPMNGRRLLTDEIRNRHRIDDFYYGDGQLEESLSLVALCSNDGAAYAAARRAFLGGGGAGSRSLIS